MTTQLMHGTHLAADKFVAHVGQCWTTSERSATEYSDGGSLYVVQLDLGALNVVSVAGYDHDTDTAPGDSQASLDALIADGVDVIVYEDADARGRRHDTYRLISAAAVLAVAGAMYETDTEE